MSLSFCDLDGDTRMAFLTEIDKAGAGEFRYNGPFVSVQVPCIPGGLATLDAIAAKHGLTRHDDGYFFPLGTDQPDQSLRWDASYPGSKGFTYTVSYRPCTHNGMVPNDQPGHAWKCGACGYVYGEAK